jgi:flagellar biogenesis protein FliO
VLSAKEVAEVKAKMPRARSQEEMTKTEMFVNFLLAIALFLLFALLFMFIEQRKK